MHELITSLRAHIEERLAQGERYVYQTPSNVVLAYFEPHHTPFLERVAAAISKEIAPATVTHLTDRMVPTCALLLAPIPEKLPHTLTDWNGTPLLPLHPIDTYLQDVEKKRALWNALKTLPTHVLRQSS